MSSEEATKQLENNNTTKPVEVEVLLGSTFLPPNDSSESGSSSHGLRASARVIHKTRMDLLRAPSPPTGHSGQSGDKKDNDTPSGSGGTGSKKSDHKNPKTPNQPKPTKVGWSNAEKNMFFEALNEYGRDFEAIATYINNKQRRRNVTDSFFRTKDQVRVLYYQFYQKASKYLKFSDEVKKNAQELYALINYGEIRKKIVFLASDKAFMKLHDLVYKGCVTLRIKGKNIKVKTPSCRALRKLNQLEEWQEEIKLPQRIDVYLKPANVDSWGRVQAVAQNPRIRTQVSLQQRISKLLLSLQHRWRSQDMRLQERTMTMLSQSSAMMSSKSGKTKMLKPEEKIEDALLCFAPPPDVPIHRPVVHLSEFLSSDSICLNAYETRIGVKVRGETLSAAAKRQRHDSEVKVKQEKSPEQKKARLEPPPLEEKEVQELLMSPNSSSRDSLSDSKAIEILDFKDLDILSDVEVKDVLSAEENCDKKPPVVVPFEIAKVVRKKTKKKEVKPTHFRPLISSDVLREIREGWTVKNASDLTFGDFYVMFGAESKLHLEYSWVRPKEVVSEAGKVTFENPKAVDENISAKLQELLKLTQLSDKLKRKPSCSCGHICKRLPGDLAMQQNGDLFKHPSLHRRNSSISDFRNKFVPKFGGSRFRTRPLFPSKPQIIVQRFLPVQPGMNQTYGVLSSDGSLPSRQPLNPEECHITIQSADGEISQILTAKMNQIVEKRDLEISDSFGSFMDLSLPAADEEFVYPSTPLMSPMGILRESPVEGHPYNVEDVSLSSILGHLENACSGESDKREGSTDSLSVLNFDQSD